MYAKLTLSVSIFFFLVVTSPSIKISNPHDSSFFHPSVVPSCFSAIMGKDKI
jgi:hypothetical protein